MARVIKDLRGDGGLWLKSLRVDGVTHFTVSGQKWRAMQDRCKVGGAQQSANPSYIGCEMSDTFKNFQSFVDWCQVQVGYESDYELDKDLLIRGNKLYGEDTCLFLPKELNNILLKGAGVRGSLPIGAVYRKDTEMFRYQLNIGEKNRVKSTGYTTAIEAFEAYKKVKEAFIKQQATKWRSQIDPRAYEALMSYQVLVTD